MQRCGTEKLNFWWLWEKWKLFQMHTTIPTRIPMKKLWKLPFLVALNPIQRTMLVGSIGLWSANHVRLIAVERPIDKIRLQLLRVILYRLPHPFLLHSNQFGNNLIFKFKKSLCTEFPMRWKTFTIFFKKNILFYIKLEHTLKVFFVGEMFPGS